ncbi:growth-regulated alpha protein-like [Pipra filicauda]|uniref:Growth-regulated alpha protein-like n=1 Tax=Pipra filicauda TaxID=649802 RepID=A0A7R5KIE9_9PASS|nr:growth-regulated alpha protein-like [Pipra filicauda]
MRLLLAALALLLLLSNLVPGGMGCPPSLPPLRGAEIWCGLLWGAGLSLESLLTNMRCKCIKSTAQVINLGLILTIDVTPPGLHCRRKEIILTLKKNKRVCVAPEAPWIQLLVQRLTQRNAARRAAAARPRREAQQRRPCPSPHGSRAPAPPPSPSVPALRR